MISKFNGTCRYCKRATLAGRDHYDLDTKTGYHAHCEEAAESAPPGPAAFRLASDLGFIGPGEAVPGSWKVWDMSPLDRSPAAGRTRGETRERPEPTLFGEE